MGAQTHADDGAKIDDDLTPTHHRAVREAARVEGDIEVDGDGYHAVQCVRHADGTATVWVVTEGLDDFVIDMFGKTDYTVVDYNGERVTCAFRRRFNADD